MFQFYNTVIFWDNLFVQDILHSHPCTCNCVLVLACFHNVSCISFSIIILHEEVFEIAMNV